MDFVSNKEMQLLTFVQLFVLQYQPCYPCWYYGIETFSVLEATCEVKGE